MFLRMKQANDRPYFLWDYDLTNDQVNQILHGNNKIEKIWMLSRILESARFEDIWKYTTVKEVKTLFPELKLKKPIRQAWEHALSVWQ